MKYFIVSALLMINFSAMAESAKSSPKKVDAKVERSVARAGQAIQQDNCQVKIATAIRRAARAMGEAREIGFEVQEGLVIGKDGDLTLSEFGTSVFHINSDLGGYISNSGAVVIVANAGKECRLLKMSLNVGAPLEAQGN